MSKSNNTRLYAPPSALAIGDVKKVSEDVVRPLKSYDARSPLFGIVIFQSVLTSNLISANDVNQIQVVATI